MSQYIHFSSYSPAADIVVASICIVMMVLVYFSYISRTRGSRLFLTMVALVFVAACSDILFYTLAARQEFQTVANWVRCAHHAALLLIFVYIAYICEVTHYENHQRALFLANLIYAVSMLADVIVTAQGLTFIVEETGIRFIRRGIFFPCLSELHDTLHRPSDEGPEAPVPPDHVRLLRHDRHIAHGAGLAGHKAPVLLHGLHAVVAGHRHDVRHALQPV